MCNVLSCFLLQTWQLSTSGVQAVVASSGQVTKMSSFDLVPSELQAQTHIKHSYPTNEHH